MQQYLLKRLFLIVITLLGISLISFLIVTLAPGDRARSGGPATRDDGAARVQLVHQLLRRPGQLDELPARREPVVQPVAVVAAEKIVGVGDVPIQ